MIEKLPKYIVNDEKGNMKKIAIAVVTLAVAMLLAWGFVEALDEELGSHSAEYWKGVEEYEN